MDFNDSYEKTREEVRKEEPDLWRMIQEKLDEDDLDGAFRIALEYQDDIYLIRLMMFDEGYLAKLTKNTALELTSRQGL